jgi:serpin B
MVAAAALGLCPVLPAVAAPSAPADAGADAVAAVASLTDLGQALLRPSGPANAVVSPVAVAAALGLVQAGAQGPAEQEIEALFGPGPRGARALRSTVPGLLRQLQAEGGAAVPLARATRLWVDEGAAPAVPAAYAKRLSGRWQSDARRVVFGQSEAARGQINAWTSERTAGRVAELLPPGSVSAATQMALTTAVHFRSPWQQPFDPGQTAARPFQTADGQSKPVPTMLDERTVLQARIEGQLVMELPFSKGGAGGYALLVAVPDEGRTETPGLGGAQLARWRAALQPLKCALALPRFAMSPQSGSLKPALQALGVKTVFTDAADLRPMLGRQARLAHLEDVHHAAGITVDEQGGEAVAAAAATVRSKSIALPVPPCAVDRAFAFVLVHQASGMPVFMGRVGDPSLAP